MNHLNYFFPYENKRGDWEDTLTRAFLIVLKYIPLAQQMFVDLIREKQINFTNDQHLPSYASEGMSFEQDCQTKCIRIEEGMLISVVITNHELSFKDDIHPSQREAVYDGIVYLGEQICIIIEHKPSASDIWPDQLNPSKSSLKDKNIQLVGHPLCLTWQNIFERLNSLIKRDLFNSTEKRMINDFFEFIDHFPRFKNLKPYTTLQVCKTDYNLLNKRCINLLEDLGKVEYHPGWKDALQCNGIVRKVALDAQKAIDRDVISMEVHPGSNTADARLLYQDLDRERVRRVRQNGWRIIPGFKISDSFRQFFWAECSMDIEDYLNYWHQHQSDIGRYKRDQFSGLLEKMLTQEMISKDEYKELESSLINSGRNVANVIPGISCFYNWPLGQAVQLDNQGEFSAEIKKQLQIIFSCWDQTLDSILSLEDLEN